MKEDTSHEVIPEEANVRVPRSRRMRSAELDIARAAAIMLIVATHLNGYTSAIKIPAPHFTGELGRTAFVFISGYCLAIAYGSFGTWRECGRFLAKRSLRIYPLYILALFTFVMLFHHWGVWHQWSIAPALPTIVTHLVGGQVLASPRIVPMETLWFIGCIIPYYVVYVVLAKNGENSKRLLVAAAVMFTAFAAIKVIAGLIDYRFFYYYPIFVGGILAGKANVLGRLKGNWRIAVTGISVGTGAMAVAMLFLWVGRGEMHDYVDHSLRRFFVSEGFCGVFSVGGILLLMCLSSMASTRLRGTCGAFLNLVSVSSYAVYLFHRPVLAVVAALLHKGRLLPTSVCDILVIAVGVPATLALGHYVQQYSDVGLGLLTSRRLGD